MEVTLLTKENAQSIFTNLLEQNNKVLLSKMKKEMLADKKLSVEEAANQCDVIPLTMRNWLKKGIVKGGKIGHRIYILQSDLDNAMLEVKSLRYKRK